MTMASTVWKKSRMRMKGHETVMFLFPVNPIRRHADANRAMDMKTVVGESRNFTSFEFLAFFHKRYTATAHRRHNMAFRGKARNERSDMMKMSFMFKISRIQK
jgi:hypothetical protein